MPVPVSLLVLVLVLVAEIPPLWHVVRFDFALCGPEGRLDDEFELRVRVRRQQH